MAAAFNDELAAVFRDSWTHMIVFIEPQQSHVERRRSSPSVEPVLSRVIVQFRFYRFSKNYSLFIILADHSPGTTGSPCCTGFVRKKTVGFVYAFASLQDHDRFAGPETDNTADYPTACGRLRPESLDPRTVPRVWKKTHTNGVTAAVRPPGVGK